MKLFDSNYSNSYWYPTASIEGVNVSEYSVFEGYVAFGQAIINGYKFYDPQISRTIINLGGVGCIYAGEEYVVATYYAQIHVYENHLYLNFSKARLSNGLEYDQPLSWFYGII